MWAWQSRHTLTGVLSMWVEMNCAVCGYRESTDHDERTVEQIETVCNGGCPHCGNDSVVNPFWFQHAPDGELTVSHPAKFILIKWWPDTPTPEHQQRIDGGFCIKK
jgi:hypothetical protein